MAYDWKKLSEYLNLYEDEQICISCPWWRDIYSKTGREWIVEFGDSVDEYDVEYFCGERDCSPAPWNYYICVK